MLLIKAHHALPKLRAEAYCVAGLLGCDAIGSRDATMLNAAFPLQIYIKTYVYSKGCYIKQCFINLIHLNEFIDNFVHLYFPSCTIQGLVKTEMDFV